jgi:2-haloacid dehalogenase
MKITQKPALIFDFGGVLLDWDPRNLFRRHFDGDTDSMEKFLVEIDFYTWNFQQDNGRTFAEGVAELSARFPQYAGLIKAYDEEWEESIRGPIQATVDTLQPLRDCGHLLFGLTNWSSEKFRLVQHKFAFFSLFETILVSGMVGLAKPDPRIFQMLLEKINRPSAQCVLIDDSLGNIIAARQLGFQTIHFVSAPQMLEELSRIELGG